MLHSETFLNSPRNELGDFWTWVIWKVKRLRHVRRGISILWNIGKWNIQGKTLKAGCFEAELVFKTSAQLLTICHNVSLFIRSIWMLFDLSDNNVPHVFTPLFLSFYSFGIEKYFHSGFLWLVPSKIMQIPLFILKNDSIELPSSSIRQNMQTTLAHRNFDVV